MKSQIIRRPDCAGGGITEEERQKMAAHSELWMRTPEQVFAKFPADKHPPALKLAIERAINHQREREVAVDNSDNSEGRSD